MERFIVRYKVKPEQVEHNAELVRAVFAELEQTAPDGLHYATLRLADGTFVHLVAREELRTNPLPELAAFQSFQAGIEERCEEQPVFLEADVVGSFRFFEEAVVE
jgi:hypothetical protein